MKRKYLNIADSERKREREKVKNSVRERKVDIEDKYSLDFRTFISPSLILKWTVGKTKEILFQFSDSSDR